MLEWDKGFHPLQLSWLLLYYGSCVFVRNLVRLIHFLDKKAGNHVSVQPLIY